jgi:hypothetical protein
MGLRPTHLGYAYQDLLTALHLLDLVLARATTVIVDTKAFKGDRFDDVTTVWATGGRQRIQIKHTAYERELTTDSRRARLRAGPHRRPLHAAVRSHVGRRDCSREGCALVRGADRVRGSLAVNDGRCLTPSGRLIPGSSA